MLSLTIAALAFMLGTLPAGQAILAHAGLEARLNSAHHLGLSNVIFRFGTGVRGLRTLLAASLPDLLKGALPTMLGAAVHEPGVAILAGLAAYLGHVNAPRLIPGVTVRGRGTVVLTGVLLGLILGGTLPLWAGLTVLAVALTLLLAFRYVSVSVLGGLVTLALTVAVLPFGTGSTLAALALLLAGMWRFKEHLGRLQDDTEPRLGTPVPLAGRRADEVVAAFMIHPLTPDHLWQARRLAWLRPLVERGVVPQRLLRWALHHVSPMKVGELTGIRTPDGVSVRCHLISVPLLPDVFHTHPDLATRRAIQGARLAQELGASVVGLGSFWSVVGNKGADVQAAVPDITVTNGGAFTAGTVQEAIPGILEHFEAQGRDLRGVTAAVVGANGVVAFGIARTIAPRVGRLILIGRDQQRLDRSTNTLRRAFKDTQIEATTAYEVLPDAELIFTATSDPDPVIFSRHVSPGTWIFDEGRPADVDAEVTQVPGVRVIPGGVVRPPGQMTTRIDLQFGPGNVPACLAETLIIAATGERERQSLGSQTRTENIQFFVETARRLNFAVLD